MKKGEYDKAAADYEEAVKQEPKAIGARYDLAWLLSTCPEERLRDGKRAVEIATQICELTRWRDFALIDALAAAYAESGKFKKAVKLEKKAVDTASKDAEKEECRMHLKLYQDGKPLHEGKTK